MSGLLERETELAELGNALAQVQAGTGCAVAIEGRAGLGKTHLLGETRRAGAEAGLTLCSARATELEREFPFALVRQLFESHLGTLPRQERDSLFEGAAAARGMLGLDPSGAHDYDSFSVLHGLYWLTASLAEREPLLLAIDDAHSADSASLDYLGFLMPRLEELPVLLVIASRPDEPSDRLRRILTDPAIRHLTLQPLSAKATTTLLTQELGRPAEPTFSAACHEMSGGNPFLLSELIRTLSERGMKPVADQGDAVRGLVPERVAHMVLMRLERLPSNPEAIARALAVLGDDSELPAVAELAGIDVEAARRAADELRASALFDPGISLRFAHPLVRNTIYESFPASERAMAHAQAAILLRKCNASVEQVATQLLASEPAGDRETVETLIEAAKRALSNGAPRSAVADLIRALREPPPRELRAAVLGPLIDASVRAADHSVLAAIEADISAEIERDPSLRSRWAGKLTMSMALAGRFDEAASMLGEAVEVAVAEGDVELAFRLEAQLRTLALLVPSVPEVNLERYANQIDPDSPGGRLAAVMEARTAVVKGTASEAADAARRALSSDGVIFAEEPELAASAVAVMTLVVAEDMETARRAADRALAIARDHGATPALVRAWFLSGFVAWAHGDLSNAEADLRQAIDLARLAEIVPAALMYTPPLTQVLIERDEMEAAKASLESIGMATGPVPKNAMFSMLLVVRTHLRVEQSEFEGAAEDSDTLLSLADNLGLGPGPAASVSPFAARALVAIGERERARDLAERTLVDAERWGAPATVAHVLRAVAVTREGGSGIDLLQKAVAILEDSPWRLERAYALVDLGVALRRDSRQVDAREPLREGFKLARLCGGARVAKRALDELEASGERVRRYTPIGVESLTPSERRVAELAAAGLTNRQIAQSLFVTVKTVEAHLSGAYDKLDIGSRRQLAAALSDLPSHPDQLASRL